MAQENKSTQNSTAGNSDRVLIPVDFSVKGELALKVGFELAARLSRKVVLIHASVVANPMVYPQFPDDFNGVDNENAEIEEMELGEEIHIIDEKAMERLKKKISSMQQNDELPKIAFDTVLAPGMPEEVIEEYCTVTPPAVIVMATRGCQKRQEELIGSVTAEVIDHCIAPVFTVPEDYSFAGFKNIVNICFFCHLDDGDFKAVDCLMKMFDNPHVKIFLFPASDKLKGEVQAQRLQELRTKLQLRYPDSEFFLTTTQTTANMREVASELFQKENIQLILIPNRKRNALRRFFNPGLAHKILYEIDFPMLDIPIHG